MTFPNLSAVGSRVPPPREMSITIEVASQFTEQAPARIRIQFENRAAKSREFLFGPDVLFGPLDGVSDRGDRLHVIPDTHYYKDIVPATPHDGCWELTTEYGIPDHGVIWRAEPGGTEKMTYVVLADPKNRECLPRGIYRFEGKWGESWGLGTNEEFSWEFELVLMDASSISAASFLTETEWFRRPMLNVQLKSVGKHHQHENVRIA